MEEYNPQKIEKKWQERWEKEKFYQAEDFSKKPKVYILVEFPYPSGDGLHVGHCRSYTALDLISRKKRMEGFNVFFPMGWDAFGLPTENYAIKTGVHPSIVTEKNTAYFKQQEKSMGFSFDWSREINTTDPKYYKWTQWIFLKLYEKELAYKSKMPINWCPSCKIGLANEEVVDGNCERCGAKVEKREKEQWLLKITKYADRLLKDLDLVDYPEKVKILQKEWIGRSEGTQFEMPIYYDENLKPIEEKLEVFTTRIDTVFGMTYVVVSAEHPLVSKITTPGQKKEVEKYIGEAKNKMELERLATEKEKTGVFSGSYVLNIFNNQKIPIYISDYVLMTYGTGAIMAVPAHDERDYIFAKKHGIKIKQVITPDLEDYEKTQKLLEVLKKISDAAKRGGMKFWLLGGLAHAFYAGVIYRKHSDLDLIVKDNEKLQEFLELLDGLGFEKIRQQKKTDQLTNFIYRNDEGIEIDIGPNIGEFGVNEKDFEEDEKELDGIRCLVMSRRYLKSFKEYLLKERKEEKDKTDMEYLEKKGFVEDGILVDSGDFSGLKSDEAREKMTEWLEKQEMGDEVIYYKLRDWIFSRQHYWGEPIPMINCPKCDWVPVPEKDLPVELPKVEKYQPTDTGESPLANIKEWVNTECPKCGGPAKRETDTMPNWAGSNWYYLAYLMRGISNFPGRPQADSPEGCFPISKYKEVFKYWMPVDWYNGGMEHTTLHLLYSRFIYKFLWDIGAVPKKCGSEPYKKRTCHGMVLGEGGIKMSKSKGNVVNPDDIVKEYGADTLRIYELFMGPFGEAIAWDSKGVKGVRRFLEKVWKLQDRVHPVKLSQRDTALGGFNRVKRLLHKTIKKVSEDVEAMKFNTTVSSLMILVNEMDKQDTISADLYSLFLIILSPFAPHISEELWSKLSHSEGVASRRPYGASKKSIFLEKWPKYDPKIIKEEKVSLIIQVNGKVRDKIEVDADISEKEAKEIALAQEKIKKWLEGKQIKKVFFVSGKLINLVI